MTDGNDANLGPGIEEGLISPNTKFSNQLNSPTADDEKKETTSASVPLLLAIALPRLAASMAWAAQWAALGPYLSTMLPNSAVQATQLIGPLSGIIVAPIVGVFSDKSSNKFGRRRPLLVGGAIASAICWTLMGFTREMGTACGDYGDGTGPTDRTYTAVFTIIFYIWMDITVNIVMTPGFLIIADFAGDRQTLGASIGQGWSMLGQILVAIYIEAFGSAYLTIHWFLGMLAVVMLLCVAICCFCAKETPIEKPETTESMIKQVGNAFYQIYYGIKTLTGPLIVYWIVFFLIQFGHTSYNGNKGQFFGLEVFDGQSQGADNCGANCNEAQQDYNEGVQTAGGRTDLIYNVVGYAASWVIPYSVRFIGAKWTLAVALVPQMCFIALAYTTDVSLAMFWVCFHGVSQCVIFSLMVPVIVHVFGSNNIGVYVGALNSANAGGQLLNFLLGTATVDTSMGYKLPVLLGGIISCVAVFVTVFFLKLKMYSM